MATGASTAEFAILMVDARHGIMTQTRRHSTIVHLLGVDKIVLAINKMDLVDYSQHEYEKILADYQSFAADIGIKEFTAIPVSALKGDNITEPSQTMGWYTGPSLIEFLETVPLSSVNETEPFSMPVQWVNRPNLDFRGFAGQITTGKIAIGDTVEVLPAKVTSTVKSIVTFENELTEAQRAVHYFTLNDEIDISRGDVLVAKDTKTAIGNRFLSTLLWMSEDAFVPGKPYWIKPEQSYCLGPSKHRTICLILIPLKNAMRQHCRSMKLVNVCVNLTRILPMNPTHKIHIWVVLL